MGLLAAQICVSENSYQFARVTMKAG